MRHTFAAGKISPAVPITLARVCSWCNRYMSYADEELHKKGAQLSHGMCADCAQHFEREIEENDRRYE